ncbi:MAG: hypothetical protein P8Q97_18540 [Myxococcota bacterium]|jgi:hypothetical protein|nr:hypothetical protein [Myxococcota bacterium]
MKEPLLGVVALLVVHGTFALWVIRIKQVQIPANRMGFVLGWPSGAVLGLIALATQGGGWLSGLPVPTTILADAAGVVRWIDQSENFQRRPEPGRVLCALEEHLA